MQTPHAITLLLLLMTSFGIAAAETTKIKHSLPPNVHVAINPIEVDVRKYISNIVLPSGFHIDLYAEGVTGARSMALSPAGTLFVGTRTDKSFKPMDSIYAITKPENGHKKPQVITLSTNLNVPNGVAFKDGNLYVAEIHRIIRYDDIEANLKHPPQPKVIYDGFPNEFHHGWKYLRFGPDGRLYVSVGSPCNTCEPAAGQGVIASMQTDGSDLQIYASGIRNSVGFDWQPRSHELWFTDNGRDMWGDDIPPEELNHAATANLHFGFPYRYGKSLVDNDFKTHLLSSDFTPATLEFPAHNALLGMRFYSGDQFPEEYQNQLFIAAHGSWNREVPDGYSIFKVDMKDDKAMGYKTFASGWLTREKKFWGRPVDIEQMPDGSLLVSDDFADVIYRISYRPE